MYIQRINVTVYQTDDKGNRTMLRGLVDVKINVPTFAEYVAKHGDKAAQHYFASGYIVARQTSARAIMADEKLSDDQCRKQIGTDDVSPRTKQTAAEKFQKAADKSGLSIADQIKLLQATLETDAKAA